MRSGWFGSTPPEEAVETTAHGLVDGMAVDFSLNRHES